MSNWLQAAEDAVKGAYCQYLGAVDNYYGFWESVGIPTGEISPILRSYVCDNAGPPPPPPPFTGGQCPGVLYRVQWRWQGGCRNNQLGPLLTFPGPIRAVFHYPVNPPFNAGVTVDAPGGGNTGDGCGTQNPTTGITEINVFRADGQPDTCGDPAIPPTPLPPEGVEQPISFTYVNVEGDTITELGDLTIFAPVIAPSFELNPKIYAPFRLQLGPNSFKGTLELPDLNFDLRPEFTRRGPGSDPDTTPIAPGPDNPDTPDDETERILTGILVRSEAGGTTSTTELFQPDGPNIYVPRLANAYFRVRVGNQLSWAGPYDVKMREAFIPAPADLEVVTGAVSWEQGWIGTATNVFRQTTPDPPTM